MRFRFSACAVLFLLATSLPATAQTAAEAEAFVDSAETVLDRLGERAARAAWVQATYITPDTKNMSARTSETLTAAASQFASEAARFSDTEGVPYAVRRKLDFLRSGLTMPAPPDAEKTARLTRRSVDLESAYAQGEWCPGEASSARGPFAEDADCLALDELTDVMARSRDEDASAIIDYYAPLMDWLREQNDRLGAEPGW